MTFDPGATRLLHRWRGGDGTARDELVALLHDEIHAIAARHLSGERDEHTLQATALVNEAWLLLHEAEVSWVDRAHFLALTSRVMRRVLVDHARRRLRAKRGGGVVPLRLEDAEGAEAGGGFGVSELDEALSRLEVIDPRKARALEMFYFGGLGYEEIAQAEEISPATVKRDLSFARAWLHEQLT